MKEKEKLEKAKGKEKITKKIEKRKGRYENNSSGTQRNNWNMKKNGTENRTREKRKRETLTEKKDGEKKEKKTKTKQTHNEENFITNKKNNVFEEDENKTSVTLNPSNPLNEEKRNETFFIEDERFTFDNELWRNFKKEESKKGIIYIPDIPIGMSISKIKEIFGEFGEIENIHINKAKNTEVEMDITSKVKTDKIRKYVDGFIEFSSKKDAIKVEKFLNNKFVGGKKRKNMARDCLWHVKYIKNFTWIDLTEHILQRKLAKADKFKFAVRQMYKDYSNYIEYSKTKTGFNNHSKKQSSDSDAVYDVDNTNADSNENENQNTLTENKKRIRFGKNNSISKRVIKDSLIVDPFEKRKNVITKWNQKPILIQTSNKKYSKQKKETKPVSADFVKLLL